MGARDACRSKSVDRGPLISCTAVMASRHVFCFNTGQRIRALLRGRGAPFNWRAVGNFSRRARDHDWKIRNREIRTAAGAVQASRAGCHGRRAPLRGIRIGRGHRGRREGVDHAHSRGPCRQDRGDRPEERDRSREDPRGRRRSQPRFGSQGRGAGSSGAGRAPDEREPAHRRVARCGRCPRDRPAHRASTQPRVHHGRSDLSQGPDCH